MLFDRPVSLKSISLPEILIDIGDSGLTGVLSFNSSSIKLYVYLGNLIFQGSLRSTRDLIFLLSDRQDIICFESLDEEYAEQLSIKNSTISLDRCVLEGLQYFSLEQWQQLSDKWPSPQTKLSLSERCRSSLQFASDVKRVLKCFKKEQITITQIAKETIYSETQVNQIVCVLLFLGLLKEDYRDNSWKSRWQVLFPQFKSFKVNWGLLLGGGVSLGATLSIGCSGMFVPLELKFLDLLQVKLRRTETLNNITVIEIDESDLENLGEWPMSDRKLAEVLEKIEANKPSVVGLDIYRNLKVGDGYEELNRVFLAHDNIIGIEKVLESQNHENTILPPLSLQQLPDRVGFSDALLDRDGLVRRGLLSLNQDETTKLSLGTRLALEHLAQKTEVEVSSEAGDTYIGSTRIYSLQSNNSLYETKDLGGYQMSIDPIDVNNFNRLSLSQFLAGDYEKEAIENKIVLIGSIAASLHDFIVISGNDRLPGVYFHAGIANQLLLAGIYGREPLRIGDKRHLLISIALSCFITFLALVKPEISGFKFKVYFCLVLSIGISSCFGIVTLFFVEGYFVGGVTLLWGLFCGACGALLVKDEPLLYIDSDSRLPNNKGFLFQMQSLLDLQFEAMDRSTLFIFQIDNFQQLPHRQLKQVIEKFTALIKTVVECEYLIGRLNVDRFGLFVSSLDRDEAVLLKQKLQIEIVRAKFPLSLSIGMASFDFANDYISSIGFLATADSDLFEANLKSI
jgi:CHASE2 domain-containing sensor protein/GGDEF domain-containing protein